MTLDQMAATMELRGWEAHTITGDRHPVFRNVRLEVTAWVYPVHGVLDDDVYITKTLWVSVAPRVGYEHRDVRNDVAKVFAALQSRGML